eukprot:gene34385-biopygen28322
MTGPNAVEVPRTEEIDQVHSAPFTADVGAQTTTSVGAWVAAPRISLRQRTGADLDHGLDKLRGRQLLSFFADYGGSVNNAGARIVGPPACRFDISTLQPPLAMAGGITDVGSSAVDTTTSDDRGDHLKDHALEVAPAVEHWCHPSDPTAVPANPMAATLGSTPLQQVVSRGAPRASMKFTYVDDNHKADDERPKEATVLDAHAAVAESFAAEDKYGAPTVPAGVAATPTLPEDTAEVAGDDAPRMETATLAAR